MESTTRKSTSHTRSIKELDYLAKMIKVIVTLQQGPKQQLFGFPNIHARVEKIEKVEKIHARMIKFHEKYFIESIPYEQVNPSRKQIKTFRNIHDIENKLTSFQIYPETEFAYKYRNPLHKTQYSEILVEYEKGFDMTTGKIKFNPYATNHPINVGTSYIPVNFQKTQVNLLEN